MQTVYILVNSNGILLGIYRDYHFALRMILEYQQEQTLTDPTLYLYKVSTDNVNKKVSNHFECIWMG